MRFPLVTLLFLMCLILITGCEKEYKDLRNYVKKLKLEKIDKEKNKTLIQQTAVPKIVTYQSAKLRAPFLQPEMQRNGPKSSITDPLQSYPVGMLRFIGTVSRNNKIYAYVQTPDNMIFEVKEGDLIGDHYGKVMSIETKRLTIKEQEFDHGKTIQHLITMQLREEN